MSQDIKNKRKKKQCPYCPDKKRNLENHIRLAHPERVDVLVVESLPQASTQATSPAASAEGKGVVVKKIRAIKWWRLILGIICGLIGTGGIVLYGKSLNIAAGVVAIAGLVPGVFLLYYAFNRKESGYFFQEKGKEYTGRENAIVISAAYNPGTKKAVADQISFEEINPPLTGARPHLLRNTGKHYYEYLNIVGEGKTGEELRPVSLPDKKLCTPEAFCIPSNMPRTKEYMEFNPPTNLQKLATGALLLTMVIIGILMVMTSPAAPAVGG